VLFSKEFSPKPRIADRREIWIEGGLRKSSSDTTDYENIRYVISEKNPVELEGFQLYKKYTLLSVYQKYGAGKSS
jgi:hypothetical protein